MEWDNTHLEDLKKIGFDIYPGCRIEAFHHAAEYYGLDIDELLGKFSDDDVLKAIYTSLCYMGVYASIDDD